MSKTNELVLKPIGELLEESFYIPAYQRGYRWTKRQVVDLLDDIKEFQQQSEDGTKESFYCLQPVVVKKNGDEWELVDGQQRLTTIFIILSYLKDIAALLGKSSYCIRYATRPDSARFLEEIDQNLKNKNIDFYHICEAYTAIDEWFESQDGTYKLKFLQTLLSDNETGKNVKVIWYQINEDEDATVVFSRLNIGKIPLTNAELVKALFLRSSNFDQGNKKTVYLNQLKIAQEWDAIEKQLQDNEFWYFISNTAVESNRIELVLKLVAQGFSNNATSKHDSLYTFISFNEHLTAEVNVIEEWMSIKRYFMTLNEWFNDRILFHLIGYLIHQEESVDDLIELSRSSTSRQGFRRNLVLRIYNKVFSSSKEKILPEGDALHRRVEEQLEQLTYNSGPLKIKPVLLLFNVASLLLNPQSNSRFQFNRFKNEAWDIEHIRSVASEIPGSKEKQKSWLENVVKYISSIDELVAQDHLGAEYDKSSKLRDRAIRLLNGKTFDSDIFEILYSDVIALYDPQGEEEVDQSIGNLTLLDSSTNRSYKNAVFPIKRQRIIALDKSATFIPLCTKNVFLKYYSQHVDKMMFWEARDSKDHQVAMVEALVLFFSGQGTQL